MGIEKNEKKGIAVIGGANVDIKGISATDFHYGSSNPGKVYKAAGGVARNIAENLGRLNLPVSLYTVTGDDQEGNWLIDVTAKAGVDTRYVKKVNDRRTGIYLSVLNESKEQVGSIADMEIFESFNKEYINQVIEQINSAKIIFLDTNFSEERLAYIFELLDMKDTIIVTDPVSVKKAGRIKGFLDKVSLITPNKEEAEVLTGIKIESEKDLKIAAQKLRESGVKQVVITLGAEGIFAVTSKQSNKYPGPDIKVVDTTGAGDAFLSGVIYGLYQNLDIFEASYYGLAMAAITLQREESVASDLTVDLLKNTKKELTK